LHLSFHFLYKITFSLPAAEIDLSAVINGILRSKEEAKINASGSFKDVVLRRVIVFSFIVSDIPVITQNDNRVFTL